MSSPAPPAESVLSRLVDVQPELVPIEAQALGIDENTERDTVSVAIIAKNEGLTLAQTIQSIKPHVEEVVVLVDDASTDNTMVIATELADTAEYYTWTDSFADARNWAIDRCTKDWVLIMDAHEVIHPRSPSILHAILNRVRPGGDLEGTEVFSANIYMDPQLPRDGDVSRMTAKTMFLQPRLIRNNEKHYYRGSVHNWLATGAKTEIPGVNGGPPRVSVHLQSTEPPPRLVVNELIIIHTRTADNAEIRKEQRSVMNVAGLLHDIAEDPEWARSYFYLANTYYEMEQYGLSYLYYRRYIGRSDWKPERAHAKWAVANIYADHKKYDKAVAWLFDAIKDDWERPEFYLTMGDIAVQRKDGYAASHWLKTAKDMKPPITGMFLNGPSYTYMPYVKSAALWAMLGQTAKAIVDGTRAIELGYDNPDFNAEMDSWKHKDKMNPAWPNLLIYDETGNFTFTNDFAKRLAKSMNIATGQAWSQDSSTWAKFVWIEWCDQNAVNITHQPKPEGQKWIIRLHGYEVYRPDRVKNVNWKAVDGLVFCADYVRQHFDEVYDDLPDTVKVRVIPNGVDVRKWSYAQREHNTKKTIAVVGILTEKKGPQLLGMVIQRFAKTHPDYKFLLRLDVSTTPNMSEYPLRHQLEGLTNYEWAPRQDSMNRWMEDVKFLLSTSTLESFSYVVAEAMAKGIKPLIYNWRGADTLWPDYCIWRDFEELEDRFTGKYHSESYRKWVQERYPLDKQVNAIQKLLGEL